MKKIKYLLVCSLLISLTAMGCNSKTQTTTKLFNDTTINGKLILRNSLSVEKSLGDIMSKLEIDKDLPDVYFKNESGSEYLRLVFYPGDTKNAISLFEVSSASMINKNQKSWSAAYPFFKSESGIKIGMAKSEVIKTKGQKFETSSKDGLTIIRYNTDEKNGKDFLKRYNMPFYFAEYRFKNDVLVQFAFGFEYP